MSAKKTYKNSTDFTFTRADLNQTTNEGFAMAKLYADEEGDKEEVYIIAELDNGEKVAIKGCVKSLNSGDYNNAIRKPTFVITGNACEIPAEV